MFDPLWLDNTYEWITGTPKGCPKIGYQNLTAFWGSPPGAYAAFWNMALWRCAAFEAERDQLKENAARNGNQARGPY